MTASLTISDVVEQSGLSQDVVRELADTGQLPCIRTPGGHRRFDPVVVDAFLRAQNRRAAFAKHGAGIRRNLGRPAAAKGRLVRDPDQARDDHDVAEWDHEVIPDQRPSLPDEVAVHAAEAARLRLLKQHGECQIPLGTSASAKSAVIEALDAYVTSRRFPAATPLWDSFRAITAKVAAILEPFDLAQREQATTAARAAATNLAAQLASIERARSEAVTVTAAARAKQTTRAERDAESATGCAERQQKIHDLIAHGRSYVQSETTDWDVLDRLDVRTEVERALEVEVDADWRKRDVKDLVDEILDEWGDPDEGENPM